MKKAFLMPALALGLAASLPAWAQAEAAATPAAAATADAMTVVRDAETGKLRAASAAELATLTQPQAQTRGGIAGTRRAAPTMLSRRHASGATSVRMTDEMISYAVVTRAADGSLEHQCLGDEHEAHGAVHQHSHQHSVAAAQKPAAQPAPLQLK